jgi:hypothetical protein
MPVVTSCPDCARKLRVPDELLGKKVRCPGCKVVFVASADAAPPSPPAPRRPTPAPAREERIEQQPRARKAPPPSLPREEEKDFIEEDENLPRGRRQDDYEDEDGNEDEPRPRESRGDWNKVANGLNCVMISYGVIGGLFCLGMLGGAVIGGVTAANAGPEGVSPAALAGGKGFFVMTIILGLLGAANKGLETFGHFLGMAVPNKPGSSLKPLSVTTFALMAAAAGMTAVSGLLGPILGVQGGTFTNPMAAAGAGIVVAALNLIGLLCYFIGGILFILYLRALAIAVKRKDLGKQIQTFLIVAASLTGVGIVTMGISFAVVGAAFFSSAGARGGPSAGAANAAAGGALAMLGIGCIGGLAGLGMAIWYTILMVQVRGAVRSFARRR